ncbi:hypothetical protein ACPXCE_20915 [Streptomyces sp. DT24]|uniref:hypothetical protein n=1 Tax=unclassified Streptomyces TaxID=2593676 RepID=UPI0023B945AD|nr:hypothetical protein [Streptomyces sp. AM 4-1-1]WEH32508.1 hypothetical protein PZB75_03375 [Streptomyces sp. AM 4-1-1]
MTISRRIATGALGLLSFAVVGVGASPAGAAQVPTVDSTDVQVVMSKPVLVVDGASTLAAKGICSGWKNAGSLPGKWSTINDGCAHFGAKGMKMVYGWKVSKGSSICVKVKGFNAQGKKTWYGAGCGKNGQITVPWGNVAAKKEMQVKGAALLRWN